MDDKRIIRCIHCQLRQFITGDGKCRRCHESLFHCGHIPEVEVLPDPPSQPILSINKQGWGRMLENLRRERELSQRELAVRAGMARTMISKLEHRSTVPTMRTATRVALALELPSYALYQTELGESYYFESVLADSFIRELSQVIHGLHPTQYAIILDTVRSLARDRQLSFEEWRTIPAAKMETRR